MASGSEVLQQLSALIDDVMPGSKRKAPQTISYNGGFGIAVPGGGQVLVSAGDDNPWFLIVTAGLAYDVENISGALAWVNSKNSEFAFGRFTQAFQQRGIRERTLCSKIRFSLGWLMLRRLCWKTGFLRLSNWAQRSHQMNPIE